MSIDINITRHFAENFAIVVIAIGMLALIWGVGLFCKLIDGEKLDWLTKFIVVGAWLLSLAGIAGIYYIGMNRFDVMVYIIYAIASVISILLTFSTLLKNVHPLGKYIK